MPCKSIVTIPGGCGVVVGADVVFGGDVVVGSGVVVGGGVAEGKKNRKLMLY